MKYIKIIILFLIFGLLNLSCPAPPPPPPIVSTSISPLPSVSGSILPVSKPETSKDSKDTEQKNLGIIKYNNVPLEGVEIFLPFLELKTVSNNKGEWAIDKIPVGTHLLKAIYTDEAGRQKKYVTNINVIEGGNKAIDINLQNSGAVIGYVALSDNPGNPGGINIYCKEDVTYVNKSDEKGKVNLTNVPPGKQTIIISKAGYYSKIFDVNVNSDKAVFLNDNKVITLEPRKERKIIGGVVDNENKRIIGVSVSIDDEHVTCTDVDGTYVLGNIPEGEHVVKFFHPYYKLSLINLNETNTEINTMLEYKESIKAGSIWGVLKDDFAIPLEDIDVVLEPGSIMKKTSSGGAFGFSDVMPGEYVINIFSTNYCTKVIPVTVPNDKTVKLKRDIILDPIIDSQCISYSNLEDSCYADNSNILDDSKDITAPDIDNSGILVPNGRIFQSIRKCGIEINLSGIIAPETNTPIDISSEDMMVVEDTQVKSFKVIKKFRPMVDIVFLINTDSQMPETTLNSIISTFQDFVKDLDERNINFQIGCIAYSDKIDPTKNPAGIDSGEPAAYTVVGFEPITNKGVDILTFLNKLTPAFKGVSGSGLSKGLLDSIAWAYNSGKGTSESGVIISNLGWRKYSQKIFIVITNTSAWEKAGKIGDTTVSATSPWTIKSISEFLRGDAIVHVVSPDRLPLTVYSGDPKGLAVPFEKANLNGDKSMGTGGTWTAFPMDKNLDLSKLPVSAAIENSFLIQFIGNVADKPENALEHSIRVIINHKKTGKKGETVLKLKY